ncbi:MAG: flavin reductase family protein [Acidobacteriota bacterium]|nr:flavin reductase family protein [Acidobacteriota bacterium]
MVSAEQLKQTMSKWAASVTLVTTLDNQRIHAMTATSFTSVSLDPPLILVCVGKRKRTHGILLAQGKFGVVFLAAEQSRLSDLAAGFEGPEGNFLPGVDWEMCSGVPVVRNCVAWLSCSLHAAYDGGDHTIFVGKVEDTAVCRLEASPLVWYSRGYRRLQELSEK